jgi:hypothetical protein
MKYYKCEYLGIIGVQDKNIHHTSGEHTCLTGNGIHNWIRTKDLKDTYEEAQKQTEFAEFLGFEKEKS